MTAPPTIAEMRILLGRAAAHGIAPERGIEPGCEADALGFLCDALRTCILPRRLALRRDGQEVLVALAAGGRMLQIEALDTTETDLTGRALNRDAPGELARIADALRRVLEGAQRVSIACSPATEGAQDRIGGIAAAEILAALGLAPLGPSRQDRFRNLAEAAADVLFAEIRSGAAPILSLDPPDPALIDAAAGWIDDFGDLLGPDDMMFYIVLEPAPVGVALAQGAALLFEAEACADLARFWSDFPILVGEAVREGETVP